MRGSAELLEGVTGGTFLPGNQIDVLRNGNEVFPAMLQAIEQAERTVDLVTYVYWTGQIARSMARTLADAAHRGLRVRVVIDAVGSISMDNALVDEMVEAGCQVEKFRTPTDRASRLSHRTHRKVLICDERIAFTGGVGIAEEWEGDAREPEEWRDTHFRIRGPAVRPMGAAFIEHWVECGHPAATDDDMFPALDQHGDAEILVLRGSSGPFWHDVGLAMEALLRLAEHRVRITSAYFAPGDRVTQLLCDTVARGVELQILLPGTHMDNRVVQLANGDDYEPLLDCGVQIFHYERSMLHVKSVTVDGHLSMIGSANVDERSMRHNEEMSLVVNDEQLCQVLDTHFDDDLEDAETIDLERWQQRPAWRRALEALVDPFEDLL